MPKTRAPRAPLHPSRRCRLRALRSALALCAVLGLLPLGLRCAINPATGRTQLALIGESEEIQLGRQNHQQVLQTMGAYNDPALQSYVSGLGRALARSSERPNLPWTFTLLDDTAVNAFALPGGFIYVTRGILAHMNSEAELAGVLGHEIGHVTARHSVEQMSRAQLAGIGVALGSVLAPELQQMGGLLQQSVGLLLLKYSRDAERQADDLGVRYMGRKGYNPGQLAEILGVLDQIQQAQGAGATPDWLSTHPNPGDRVARIRAEIKNTPAANNPLSNPNDFIAKLDGLAFGDNPREGYFDGDMFFQPELGIQMELPQGWQRKNGKEALQAASPNGTAALMVSLAKGSSARQAAEQFFQSQGVQPGSSRAISLGGFQALDVPFAAQAQGSAPVVGRAVFVEDGRRVYQLLGYGIEQRDASERYAVDRSLASFGRVRESCRLDVEPARVEVVRAQRGMTLQDLASGSRAIDARNLAILNHLQPGAELRAGALYKKVVGGARGCGRLRD